MIKIRLGFIISLLVIVAISCVRKIDKVKKVTVTYVDFMIETPFAVSEDYFEKIFNEDKNVFEIQDDSINERIVNEVNALEINKDTLGYINVRQKVIITKTDNSVIKLSLDGGGTIYKDGTLVSYNKNLQDIINEEIRKYESRSMKK